jgi:Flp pilus assembly protein protease CpaA
MAMHVQPQHLLVIGFATAAAVYDHRTGLIPNRMVAVGLMLVLILQLLLGAADGGLAGAGTALLASGLGLLACGLIPLAIYLWGGLGGGDVKLLAMIGLEAELYAFGLGALFALARASCDGALWQTLMGSATLLTNRVVSKRLQRPVAASASTPIRFGPAIAASTALAVALHWSTP